MQEDNRTSLTGHPESWVNVASGTATITDVWDVLSLRMKLDEVSRDHEGDHAVIQVTDADGDHAGEFRFCIAKHAPDWDAHYSVTDADGNVLHNNADAYHNTQEYAPFWVDIMDPGYRFERILAGAKKPYTLTIRSELDAGAVNACPNDESPSAGSKDLTPSYAITYLQRTGEGTILRGGGGVVQSDFQRRFPGGTLTVDTGAHQRETQEYHVENGGLVLEQSEGSIFRVRPHFDAALVNNIVAISITVPTLVGDAASVTGSGMGTVYLSTRAQNWFSGQGSNMTLEVQTGYPSLWAQLWREELGGAGLTEGTHFNVSTSGTAARMDVWGVLDPAPAGTEYDVFVRMRQASIEVALDA